MLGLLYIFILLRWTQTELDAKDRQRTHNYDTQKNASPSSIDEQAVLAAIAWWSRTTERDRHAGTTGKSYHKLGWALLGPTHYHIHMVAGTLRCSKN